jgi:hypothetical protein
VVIRANLGFKELQELFEPPLVPENGFVPTTTDSNWHDIKPINCPTQRRRLKPVGFLLQQVLALQPENEFAGG